MMDQLEKMHGPIQRGVSPSHDEVVLVISQCGQIDAKPTCDGPMNSPTPVLVQIWHMQHGNIPCPQPSTKCKCHYDRIGQTLLGHQTSIVELPGGEEEDSFPSQPLYIKLEQKAYEGATLAPPVGAAEESICAQFGEATPIRYWILFALIFIPNRDGRGVYGSRFVSSFILGREKAGSPLTRRQFEFTNEASPMANGEECLLVYHKIWQHSSPAVWLLATSDHNSETAVHLVRPASRDCPNGQLSRKKFLEVYSSFFPQGNAEKFCEHVFRTFDSDNSGKIDFKEFLLAINITSAGKPEQKLEWAFAMYDVNGDGTIEPTEMIEIIQAIYNMVGPALAVNDAEDTPAKRTQEIFSKMDENKDGVLSKPEFIKGCMSDEFLYQMLTADTNPPGE
ncbi:hypothetical protein LSH36_359g02030 [Paralvinella palmiformis]|uniref:EF-hand domain-containing protein n=1 Tax=Paralvinella palmiformis TaxID=53620 RepID=A0AAD9MZV4_9ANNE|nr:hypothetical protein LSH36_359g02030 [Paralvinella palmiformis]